MPGGKVGRKVRDDVVSQQSTTTHRDDTVKEQIIVDILHSSLFQRYLSGKLPDSYGKRAQYFKHGSIFFCKVNKHR